MKAFVSVLIIALLFSHCNNPADPKKTANDLATQATAVIPVTATPVQLSGCYRATIDKDSAELQLHVSGDSVSGSLQYNRFEKDDSKGSFTGIIKNNIIRAWYHFQSGGAISIKQLVFRIDHNKLEEGYGDMDKKNDSAVFKYPGALRYEENHPYLSVTCN